MPHFMPVSELLKQCDWLSIRQLVVFHYLILLHKTLLSGKPTYIYDRLEYIQQETRTSDNLTLNDNRRFMTLTANKGFIPRTIKDWNILPYQLRSIENHRLFKTNLRDHVIKNILIR